ncbi:hypothetical protein ACLOJK_039062 [Asimina triloba]
MRRRFLSQVFFFAFVYVGILQTCYAKQADACFSSCGNVLKISYPFRLKGDPLNCGDPQYELSCEDNQTYLDLHSQKYSVVSIDYKKKTIRLVDLGLRSGNCSSSSLHSAIVDELSYGDPYSGIGPYDVISYVNCSVPMDPALFMAINSCFNTSSWAYLYAVLSPTQAHVSDLLPSCQVVGKAFAVAPGLKRAKQLSELLKLGFELSWAAPLACQRCSKKNHRCSYYNVYGGYYLRTGAVAVCYDSESSFSSHSLFLVPTTNSLDTR